MKKILYFIICILCTTHLLWAQSSTILPQYQTAPGVNTSVSAATPLPVTASASSIIGVIPVANGGTALTTTDAHALLGSLSTGTYSFTDQGTSQYPWSDPTHWPPSGWQFSYGTAVAPITTAGPTVKISRTETIDAATCAGFETDSTCNAALSVFSVAPVSQTQQVVAGSFFARGVNQIGAFIDSDQLGLQSIGVVGGTGNSHGWGAFLVGRRENSTGSATGVEIHTDNQSTSDCTYTLSGNFGGCDGALITSNGLTSASKGGAGVHIESSDNLMVYRDGIGVGTNGASVNVLDEEAVSTNGIKLNGTHTYGIISTAAAGFWGIGTLTPAVPLDIASTGGNGINLTNSTHTASLWNDGNLHIRASDAAIWIGDYASSTPIIGNSNSSVRFGGNAGNASTLVNINGGMSVGTSYTATASPANGAIFQGLVGIGTSAPSASSKLDVNGAIYIKGINGISFPSADTTTGGTIAIGASALAALTGTAAYSNTVMGYQAMSVGTSISNSSAFGNGALQNANGNNNNAFGWHALQTDTTGNDNNAFGDEALKLNTTGSGLTAMGDGALEATVSDSGSTAFGAGVMQVATVTTGDTGIGGFSLHALTTGTLNTGIGYNTLNSLTTAAGNTAGGYQSLKTDITGPNNTAFGNATLTLATANANTAFGNSAGASVTSGSNNQLFGYFAGGTTLSTGSGNLLIGSQCDVSSGSASNETHICGSGGGNSILITGNGTVSTESTTLSGLLTLPNIPTDATHTDTAVCQDSTTHQLYFGSGTLGVCLGLSSTRYKDNIVPMEYGLTEVLKLQPKNFTYKKNYGDTKKQQFGFIAEDVIDVLPALTGLDKEGKPNSVDYVGMIPILVHAVQQQQEQMSATTGVFPFHKCFFNLLVCAN